MAEFLDATEISATLTDLIKNSNDKLFLISPYLQIAERLRLHIKERDSQKIDIRVVFRTDKLNTEEMSFLQGLINVKVLSCDSKEKTLKFHQKSSNDSLWDDFITV